ncbi:TetR family transcriptional regulator [Pontibacter ummariensis]|uniref:Transcriptional regulator, TetR family n=1 Tax=Pontibacter ummariensis TaxID=1610492 RepID=A0A239H1A5_9BACT|nr:TetR/AcrR family transcriptional regulator [Pontibacter ummariensis]PRY10969.1 TetR family transcriptional regulator [Pontibacter ummariensis]SNS74054.1 transcriptional regulator, TetR family [Pontibacter ummariensis]
MSDNRSTILHCSLSLFAAKGYDAVGVQQIVETAGIKKPTLYHYFGNKRGVLEALMQEQFAPFLATLSRAASYAGDLPLTMQRVVESYFQFAVRQPTLYQMHLAAWYGNPENEAAQVILPTIRAQHQLLEQMFQQAARDHGNMRGRHQVYAATFLGMINTYIVQAQHHQLALNAETVKKALQQFSYGIYS